VSGRRDAVLLVVVAGAAFATSGPLTRWAGPVHPLALVFGRVALAALVLLAFDALRLAPSLRGSQSLRGLAPGQRRGIAAAGLLLVVHFGLFVGGLQHTSLPAAVSLVSLEPLAVVLTAWLLQGLRPTRLEAIGVLVSTAGALIIARAAGSGEHRLGGDLLVLAAVAMYGLYVAAAREYRGALPIARYAGLVYAAAALGAAAGWAATPSLGAPLDARAATAVVGLALVPTLVGHTAVQAAAKTLSPAVVALVSPAETLGALALGAVWLQATPTPTETAGALIIIAGVVTAIFARR
jgi:drug/metabolite transporter (DMT)-like permease